METYNEEEIFIKNDIGLYQKASQEEIKRIECIVGEKIMTLLCMDESERQDLLEKNKKVFFEGLKFVYQDYLHDPLRERYFELWNDKEKKSKNAGVILQ